MSKPNRVVANMSKNPWTPVHASRDRTEVQKVADTMTSEGKKVRVTSCKCGPRGPKGWKQWTVWEQ